MKRRSQGNFWKIRIINK